MDWEFDGEVVEWRGPAPFYFVETPPEVDAYLHDNLAVLSYGWGCMYADVTLGGRTERTALMPKDDVYLVPLKVALRRPAGVGTGDRVRLRLHVSDA